MENRGSCTYYSMAIEAERFKVQGNGVSPYEDLFLLFNGWFHLKCRNMIDAWYNPLVDSWLLSRDVMTRELAKLIPSHEKNDQYLSKMVQDLINEVFDIADWIGDDKKDGYDRTPEMRAALEFSVVSHEYMTRYWSGEIFEASCYEVVSGESIIRTAVQAVAVEIGPDLASCQDKDKLLEVWSLHHGYRRCGEFYARPNQLRDSVPGVTQDLEGR